MPCNNAVIDSFYGSLNLNEELKFKLGLDDNWKIVNELTFRSRKPSTVESWRKHSAGISTIDIEFVDRGIVRCPYCLSAVKIKQYRIRELSHVRGYGYDTILRVRVPQLICNNCGKTSMVHFPPARPYVSYTKEFERWVLRLMLDKNISKASEEASVGRWILWDILGYRVKEALPTFDLSDVSMIAIDETSFRRGRNFVTVVSDQKRRLIYMCEGKGKETLAMFCDWLILHGGKTDDIKVVSADMSKAYQAGAETYLPKAQLVFDKFHVFRLLNDDMFTIYKRLKRTMPPEDRDKIKFTKFTILKHKDNMNDVDNDRLNTISLVNPELMLAYDMKESFFRIYEQKSKDYAEAFFLHWKYWVMTEGCRELKIRVKKLEEKLDKILAYYDHKYTNAFAEGLNSRIQKTKADGCGFTNLDNFINFCYFRYSNLRIDFD